MKIKQIILAGLVAFFATACVDFYTINKSGTPIQFGATVVNGNGPLTKTVYSGVEETVNGKIIERIDWVEGDPIKIYMYYEGPDKTYGNVSKNYVVTQPTINENYHERSDGKVAADDPLVWAETENSQHEFYAVYPGDFDGEFEGFNKDNYHPWYKGQLSFKFNLPPNQNGSMKYAYMAATSTEKSYTAKDKGSVILQFYPMVTTLWFELNNPTGDDIFVSTIKISSPQNQQDRYNLWKRTFTGSYSAVIREGIFVTDDNDDYVEGEPEVTVNVNQTIPSGGIIKVPAFIRPRKYDTNVVYITINGVTNSLGGGTIAELLPCKKYNLHINLTKGGSEPPVIDPPVDPEPGIVSNAEAQMIFALLLKHDHTTLWDLLGDYFEEYFEYTCADPDLLNGLWNNKIKGAENLGLEQMYDELIKWFPGNKLNGLIDAIGSLTEIDLTGNGPKLTADILDFSIFKNAKSIKIDIRKKSKAEEEEGGCREIVFDGQNLPDLETIEIVGESTGRYNLTISNCHNLRECKLNNKSGLKLNQLIVKDCSPHPDVDFAYINVTGEQEWGSFNFDRQGDTQKIILVCGSHIDKI